MHKTTQRTRASLTRTRLMYGSSQHARPAAEACVCIAHSDIIRRIPHILLRCQKSSRVARSGNFLTTRLQFKVLILQPHVRCVDCCIVLRGTSRYRVQSTRTKRSIRRLAIEPKKFHKMALPRYKLELLKYPRLDNFSATGKSMAHYCGRTRAHY